MDSAPLVSIIIVNYNGKELLQSCLSSLKKITYPYYEIILVDNGSTDGSSEFVRSNFPSVIIIQLNSNFGFAKANNTGARKAKGELLHFLNNDTEVTPDFLTELIKVIQRDESIAICQSMLLNPDGTIDSSGDFIDKLGVPYNSKEKIDSVKDILSARGASMLIRKKIFEELGEFDEKFFITFEDVDLGWKSRIFGYRAVIVPLSVVYHKSGSTISKNSEMVSFHGYKNQVMMKFTNFEPNVSTKNIFLFSVIYGIKIIKAFLDYTLKGTTDEKIHDVYILKKPRPRTILKSVMWNLTNFRYIVKKREFIQNNRVCSTSALIKLGLIKNP